MPPKRPNDPPPDPSPPSAEALARIREILHRFQVPPSEADELLRQSVLEVAWREHRTAEARDDRLIRSVERRAQAWRANRLREQLAQMAAETNGHEPDAALDPAQPPKADSPPDTDPEGEP